MASDHDRQYAPKKLLIVRLGSMGDVIHALPAVAALRQAIPYIDLGWIIEERWAELLCAPGTERCGIRSDQRPLVDCIYPANTRAWRSSMFSSNTRSEVRAIKHALREARYGAVVDFQGAIKSAIIARWAKAPIYGFAAPREKIARYFYSQKIAISGKHVIEQNLELAEAVAQHKLNMPSPLLPRHGASDLKINAWLQKNNISRFALINPGAGWGAKQWPAERYGEVARQLDSDGVHCVINFGPDEKRLAELVEQTSGGVTHSMQCSITELIALTRRAALFIGGDTGPLHLAAALQIPVVAIFGPTDPARNGPFATTNIILRSDASTTSYSHHDGTDEGLMQITAQQVLNAAHDLLQGAR